jgi:hypothetical protein
MENNISGIPKEPMSKELIDMIDNYDEDDVPSRREIKLLSADGAGFQKFYITIIGDTENSMNFEVYKVIGSDEDSIANEFELYLTGSINYNGCTDIYFGDNSDPDNQAGYIHLCGRTSFTDHTRMMIDLFELAEKTITNFDKETSQNFKVNK